MKCRRNYYTKVLNSGHVIEMYPCKFNSGHQFPLIELNYHEKTCQDRNNILPHVRSVPRIRYMPPTHDELCKFKRLANRAKNSIGEDWEVEAILHPTPKFAYNHDAIEESYKKQVECAEKGVFTHDRAAQPSPIPNEDDPTDELDYIFESTDDEAEE